MLTELSITNFKSWRRIDKMRLAKITGLFGANSSGKTSILQLLLMLRQTAESADRKAVLEFGGERTLTQLGSFRDVIFGHKTTEELYLRLSWQLPKKMVIAHPDDPGKDIFSGKDLTFATKVGAHNGEKLFVQELSYEFGKYFFSMRRLGSSGAKYELTVDEGDFKFKQPVGRAWDLPAPIECYGFPDRTFARYQNVDFLGDLQLAFEELFGRLFYLGPLRNVPQRHYVWSGSEPADMGRRGERVVDALLASRERGKYISRGYRKRKRTLEETIAHWLKELGLIHSFTVKSLAKGRDLYEVRVKQAPNSSEVLITDVGFGVSQVLPVLVLCYFVPEGSTILLEQPEIHLHPSVQSGLADVLIDAAQNRQIQIILESHSEHLLRRLQRRIAEEKVDLDDVALYFCDSQGGESELSNLDLDSFGNIENWPEDFFADEFGEMAAMTEAAMMRMEAEGK